MKLIKIGALWCTSCIIVKNNIVKVLKEYPSIELIEYDLDFDKEAVAKYQIDNKVPILILEENDKEISRLTGESSKKEIIEFLEKSSL